MRLPSLARVPSLAGFVVAVFASLLVGIAGGAEPLARSFPGEAIAYLEINQLGRTIDQLKNSEYVEFISESEELQGLMKSKQYQQAMAVKSIVEAQLDHEIFDLLRELTSDRIGIAIYPQPNDNEPFIVGLVRTADNEVLKLVRERLDPILALADQQIERRQVRGKFDVIHVGDELIVGMWERHVLISNSRELFDSSLVLSEDAEQASLDDCKNYQALQKLTDDSSIVTAYVDLDRINELAGGRAIPKKLDNPLSSLLFGGLVELAAHSSFVGMTFDALESGVALTVHLPTAAGSLPQEHQAFFSDPMTPGAVPIPSPQGTIGGLVLYRDFASWYRDREELLEAQVLPGFDQFEAGLGNLLPGRNFGEDVLPLLGKQLTLVTALQTYEHLDGEPGVQLPGFGAIIDLDQPDEGADVFRLFFQTLSAILNIQAGQQGRQPWVMTSESHDGVQIAFGKYLKKPTGKRLPLVFNFMPASAQVEDKFIVASSVDLCRQLVDWYRNPQVDENAENRNLEVAVQADTLATILESNREFFHAQAVQGGATLDEAKTRFAAIMKALRYFDLAQLSSHVGVDAFRMRAKVQWK